MCTKTTFMRKAVKHDFSLQKLPSNWGRTHLVSFVTSFFPSMSYFRRSREWIFCARSDNFFFFRANIGRKQISKKQKTWKSSYHGNWRGAGAHYCVSSETVFVIWTPTCRCFPCKARAGSKRLRARASNSKVTAQRLLTVKGQWKLLSA